MFKDKTTIEQMSVLSMHCVSHYFVHHPEYAAKNN